MNRITMLAATARVREKKVLFMLFMLTAWHLSLFFIMLDAFYAHCARAHFFSLSLKWCDDDIEIFNQFFVCLHVIPKRERVQTWEFWELITWNSLCIPDFPVFPMPPDDACCCCYHLIVARDGATKKRRLTSINEIEIRWVMNFWCFSTAKERDEHFPMLLCSFSDAFDAL